MKINDSAFIELQRHISACSKHISALRQKEYSPTQINALLDAAMRQIEQSCLDMRRICETIRPPVPAEPFGRGNYHSKAIYGEVTLLDTGWLHIKLNTLLPHYKILGGSQYVSDSITRLLDTFTLDGGELPVFPKAHLVIVEHCDVSCCEAFDNDNKGFQAVINALKGRLYPDDNQFELSLGLYTVKDEENPCCHIYVLPDDHACDFQYYRLAEGF